MEPTAEQRLIDAAKKGTEASYYSQDATENDPANGSKWGADRTLDADTIYQLATGSNPAWPVHAKGVQISGARIKGSLDFKAAQIKYPILLNRCYLEEVITLTDASARTINLIGSHIAGINGDHVTVDGSVYLANGFTADGPVSMISARIDGALVCTGGTHLAGLTAAFMKVGSIFLNKGFKAKGEVNLVGAEIDGQLQCGGGIFESGLNAGGFKVDSVFLNEGFTAQGQVNLVTARIDGALVCTGGTFAGRLDADNLKVGNVFLDEHFTAKAAVSLVGAKIDGALVCKGGIFEGGLKASSMRAGTVFLHEGFIASGEVTLTSATIDGYLYCLGGIFAGLTAQSMKAGSVVFNVGFTAKGKVDLVSARIDGDLTCSGGNFDAGLIAGSIKVDSVFLDQTFKAGDLVNLVGAKIDGALVCIGGTFAKGMDASSVKVGNVFLGDGFTASGPVGFVGAEIDGQLICTRGNFHSGLTADTLKVGSVLLNDGFNAKGDVRLVSAEIGADLNCSGGIFEGNLDLTRVHAGALTDDPKSWPKPGKLLLGGFEYAISSNQQAPRDAGSRLSWIELGPKDPFLPQPYEQLVKVLHAMGDEAGARKVSIEKQRALRKRGKIGYAARLWNWILFLLVGYGYRAWLALPWAAAVIIAGGLIFQPVKFLRVPDAKVPAVSGAPTGPPDRPAAQITAADKPRVKLAETLQHPFLYSIDVFLPFADLNQKKTWQLDAQGPFFLAYQVWYLFEELAGWVLTGLLAAAATGLLKNQ